MSAVVDHGVRFGRIAVTLPVKDMGRAHDFYTRVLGFTKAFENGNPIGFMILQRDQGELHLTLQPNHPAAAFTIAHLMVDDVDRLHAACVQMGRGSSSASRIRITGCGRLCSKTRTGIVLM